MDAVQRREKKVNWVSFIIGSQIYITYREVVLPVTIECLSLGADLVWTCFLLYKKVWEVGLNDFLEASSDSFNFERQAILIHRFVIMHLRYWFVRIMQGRLVTFSWIGVYSLEYMEIFLATDQLKISELQTYIFNTICIKEPLCYWVLCMIIYLR